MATERAKAEEEEIKEFHFHVYFFQGNDRSKAEAQQLRDKIVALIDAGYFPPKSLGSMTGPVGPHPAGQFRVWCPKEYFHKVYQWFLLNRGNLTVLVHPLTVQERIDHTVRAVWMGQSNGIDLDKVVDLLPEPQIEFRELKLGYSGEN